MTSNNTEWQRGCFYLRNDEPGLPPYTGKVLKKKAGSWWHGLSPSSRQDRLELVLLTWKSQPDAGLGVASVLANLHHRRIIPLMERELRIFKMDETADPVSLARSRLVHNRFPREYAATRARRAISLKAVKHSDDDLWSFVVLPDAPPMSRHPLFFIIPPQGSNTLLFPAEGDHERHAVRPAHTPSPSAQRVRRSEGCGGGSTGNRGTRNYGCASSRDSLPSDLALLVVG
jgi:hypothetical protein